MIESRISFWSLALIICSLLQMVNITTASTLVTKPLIRLDTDVLPKHYIVELKVDPNNKEFNGVVKIELELKSSQKKIILHGKNLNFDNVDVLSADNHQTASIQELADDGTIAVRVAEAVGPGPVTLTFRYHAALSLGLEGLYKVVDEGKSAAFTQFQAIGARRAFPCFDEPGFKSTFDITLVIPQKLKAISNTKEISQLPADEGFVAHRFAITKPLPTYLIAFAVGDFDIVEFASIPPSSLRTEPIQLRSITMGNRRDEIKIALNYTAKLVLAEEQYFGIAYPFDKLDIIAVPDFGAGGMENAGAITYDENIMLLDDDTTLARRREFLSIHAHEIAHQWFGNYASPRWWDDLWLNESFASFMEVKFAAMVEPDWRFDTDLLSHAHEAMILDRASSVRRVREPVENIDGITAAFDAITYQKGAVLLAMVEDALGPVSFQAFVHSFLTQHAFGTMHTEGFLTDLSRHPGGEIAAKMLSSYINAPGLPIVNFTPDKNGLRISQSRFSSNQLEGIWQIPVCLSATKDETVQCKLLGTRESVFSLANTGDYVPFDNMARYYVFDVPDDHWRFILGATPDMPRAKALAVAINLDLAFIDGRIGFETYIFGVKAISQHKDWEVAGFPLMRLDSLASETEKCPAVSDRARSMIESLYAPMLNKISLTKKLDGNGVDAWLSEMQRENLAEVFASGAGGGSWQSQLAELGLLLAQNPEEQLDDSDIAPSDVVGAALIAAAAKGDETFLRLALTRFKNTDNVHERDLWLHAIAASKVPSATALIEELLLSSDLRNQEVLELLFARASQTSFRDSTWDIIDRNSAALLLRLEGDLEMGIIQIADSFATEEQAQRVEKTIKPLLGRLRGGSVQLQQTLEHIRSNASLLARLNRSALCQTVPQ